MEGRDLSRVTALELAIGARMRTRRRQLGLSQSDLADKLGVSFQQVQKYERGANRVSASMLESVATALGAPISYFFGKEEQEPLAVPFDDPLSSRETFEVVRAYYALPLALREKVLELLRALQREGGGTTKVTGRLN